MDGDLDESFLLCVELPYRRAEFMRDEFTTEADTDERNTRFLDELSFMFVGVGIFGNGWHIAPTGEDDDIIVCIAACFEHIPGDYFRFARDERAELVEVFGVIVDDECFFHIFYNTSHFGNKKVALWGDQCDLAGKCYTA